MVENFWSPWTTSHFAAAPGKSIRAAIRGAHVLPPATVSKVNNAYFRRRNAVSFDSSRQFRVFFTRPEPAYQLSPSPMQRCCLASGAIICGVHGGSYVRLMSTDSIPGTPEALSRSPYAIHVINAALPICEQKFDQSSAPSLSIVFELITATVGSGFRCSCAYC